MFHQIGLPSFQLALSRFKPCDFIRRILQSRFDHVVKDLGRDFKLCRIKQHLLDDFNNLWLQLSTAKHPIIFTSVGIFTMMHHTSIEAATRAGDLMKRRTALTAMK
ncbi:MAG: hypothetical protein P4M08_01290 [Oligoflexia bacterium]|nr:hypothetical protein [Oligoflexia bacterium]